MKYFNDAYHEKGPVDLSVKMNYLNVKLRQKNVGNT